MPAALLPRNLHVEHPAAGCHVMSRGDRRQAILLNGVGPSDFLKTQAEACQKTGWQVHACCLTSNH
jgi:putative transposase